MWRGLEKRKNKMESVYLGTLRPEAAVVMLCICSFFLVSCWWPSYDYYPASAYQLWVPDMSAPAPPPTHDPLPSQPSLQILSHTLAAHIFATLKTTFSHFSLHSTYDFFIATSQTGSIKRHPFHTPLATAGTSPTTAKALHYYSPNSFLASLPAFSKITAVSTTPSANHNTC